MAQYLLKFVVVAACGEVTYSEYIGVVGAELSKNLH
jgi:hypothetical protein